MVTSGKEGSNDEAHLQRRGDRGEPDAPGHVHKDLELDAAGQEVHCRSQQHVSKSHVGRTAARTCRQQAISGESALFKAHEASAADQEATQRHPARWWCEKVAAEAHRGRPAGCVCTGWGTRLWSTGRCPSTGCTALAGCGARAASAGPATAVTSTFAATLQLHLRCARCSTVAPAVVHLPCELQALGLASAALYQPSCIRSEVESACQPDRLRWTLMDHAKLRIRLNA